VVWRNGNRRVNPEMALRQDETLQNIVVAGVVLRQHEREACKVEK
jgi:hypothetical protein